MRRAKGDILMGFVWRYEKKSQQPGVWRVTISTIRRREYDEEISAVALIGAPVAVFRVQLDKRREKIMIVALMRERDDLIQVEKDGEPCRYVLIVQGEFVTLDGDFSPCIEPYVHGECSLEWLLAQEEMG
jgi:hypothetical protein